MGKMPVSVKRTTSFTFFQAGDFDQDEDDLTPEEVCL